MITLKDIDAAFAQSIGTLYNLWYAVDHELSFMEYEELKPVCKGQFMNGLDNLIEAIRFLEHKRNEIGKLISDQEQEVKA